ncbi:hypothetical protein WICPIJ_007457 [Wickerhamomyces pijperi]|uniref:Uncharacterized protein n=1 Tax=Wickerhamomyces pijperi TaxID=599730 RepID=A0A9P8PZX5_WICPI|nr:hypothetical protein WICPIJ_007457 [Wickerhamomyces pijperi]
MDKKYPLEASLLSRSHPKDKVLQLLEQRYAVNVIPNLPLSPVEYVKSSNITETINDNTSLLTKIRQENNKQNRTREQSCAKVAFKNFIKSQQYWQRQLKLKIITFKKANNVKNVDQTKFKEYKKLIKFDDFLKSNELWIDYIRDLLQISNTKSLQNVQQCLIRLSSAEYIGCFIRVLKAKNKQLQGKSGIVIYDSKNYFIVVEKGDKLKLIEKKGTLFSFVVPLFDYENEEIDENDDNYAEFTIIGSRFQYRAPDRSGKKFKPKDTDDLIYDEDHSK